jgi:hypothetical protein
MKQRRGNEHRQHECFMKYYLNIILLQIKILQYNHYYFLIALLLFSNQNYLAYRK